MKENRGAPQGKTRLAALEFLSRAIDAFSIPVRETELWVRPADVPGFVNKLEEHIRALSAFFDEYLAKHPGALRRGDDLENEYVVEQELAYARKSLDFIGRIGARVAETDAGKATSASGELKIKPPQDTKGAGA
jgi:hypothetical protein